MYIHCLYVIMLRFCKLYVMKVLYFYGIYEFIYVWDGELRMLPVALLSWGISLPNLLCFVNL